MEGGKWRGEPTRMRLCNTLAQAMLPPSFAVRVSNCILQPALAEKPDSEAEGCVPSMQRRGKRNLCT